jgi:hypothetical protein
LRHFFITYIAVKDEDTALIEIMMKLRSGFTTLKIWCNATIIRELLLQAKYFSLAIPHLYVINPRYLEEGEMQLRLKEAKSKNIEIENIILGLQMVYCEEERSHKIPYYSVEYLKTSATIAAKKRNSFDDGLPF